MAKIVKLNPYVSETVWGGNKLSKIKNIESINPIGETWEVSSHLAGSSKVGDINLSDLCSLSYLVKFIDTAANLSIQVHPDDEYAKAHENSSGKTECWLILSAQENAGIYIGFKTGTTKKEFFNAVAAGMAIDHFLNFIAVKPGDFFMLPAGSIHAIGSGVTLCEVQQSSGITYRVWDWNRMGIDGKPRELHIEKAKDVCQFSSEFNQKLLQDKKENLLLKTGIQNITTTENFKVQLFSKLEKKSLNLNLGHKDSIVILEGEVSGDINLKKFDAGIVMEAGNIELEVAAGSSFLVVSE